MGTSYYDPNPDIEKARASVREHTLLKTRSAAYVNMFKLSGYEEEMEIVVKATAEGNRTKALAAISNRMIDEISLLGDPQGWKEKIQRFRDAWLTLPVLRPVDYIAGSLERMKYCLRGDGVQ